MRFIALSRQKDALVESHIPGQSQRVGMSVPQLVALRARLIPNKRHLDRFRVELAALVAGYMHVPLASKDAKMRDIRNLTRIPELIRRAPSQRSSGGAIVDVYRGINRTCYVATERQPELRLRNGARYNSVRV